MFPENCSIINVLKDPRKGLCSQRFLLPRPIFQGPARYSIKHNNLSYNIGSRASFWAVDTHHHDHNSTPGGPRRLHLLPVLSHLRDCTHIPLRTERESMFLRPIQREGPKDVLLLRRMLSNISHTTSTLLSQLHNFKAARDLHRPQPNNLRTHPLTCTIIGPIRRLLRHRLQRLRPEREMDHGRRQRATGRLCLHG